MILVTGGAGYIGSHVVKELVMGGNDVLVLDNLSTGHKETIDVLQKLADKTKGAAKLEFVVGDTCDRSLLCSLMHDRQVTAVVHLAAYSQVGESMINPGKYFSNNVANAICLLDSMVSCGVKNMVFSSSAAVYGEPESMPITEDAILKPTNVYGASKLMVEELLHWYSRIHGIKYVALRYFNAAGADASGLIGERHDPETHLVPMVLQRVLGIRDKLKIYGSDYNTPDGTCVRDYIHVTDLASAHILALTALQHGMDSKTYNLGNGNGYSVTEVINAASNVVGNKIEYEIGQRRTGDPAVLVASSEKITNELGWQPNYTDIGEIIGTAWRNMVIISINSWTGNPINF